MITIEVNRCVDCPFFSDLFDYCTLRPKVENRMATQIDEVDATETPDWCPLKKEDSVIKFKK